MRNAAVPQAASALVSGHTLQIQDVYDHRTTFCDFSAAVLPIRNPFERSSVFVKAREVPAICAEVNSASDCRFFTSLPTSPCFQSRGSHPAGGDRRKKAAITTTAPWMTPHWMNAVW